MSVRGSYSLSVARLALQCLAGGSELFDLVVASGWVIDPQTECAVCAYGGGC